MSNAKFLLQLYINGDSLNSLKAKRDIEELVANKVLNKPYELEVIDINKYPNMAEKEKIIAIPTLKRKYPQPEIKIIGSMKDKDRIIEDLGI